MQLVIGDKALSSWSLRPWIALKQAGIPFEEIPLRLDRPESRAQIARHSPSGKVPVLIDGDLRVWESLAILEYLHDRFPDRGLLPAEPRLRAKVRAVSSEMHAGFATLRKELPFRVTPASHDLGLVAADIARVKAIWAEALAGSGGPFLFGSFTMADAMYAPVVLGRFASYGVPVEGSVAEYCRTILSLPGIREWREAGLRGE